MSKDRTDKGRPRVSLALVGLASGLVAAGCALNETSPEAPADGDGAGSTDAPYSQRQSFWIRVAPRSRTVAPGETTSQTVRIRSRGDRRVRLRIRKGIPGGADAVLRPRSTRGSRATLTIWTTGETPVGTYTPRLIARRHGRRTWAAASLNVTPSPGFEISGNLRAPLRPGLAVPLELSLTNPGPSEISISSLEVTVAGVTAPAADQTHPCPVSDFPVTQFSGEYGFTLAGSERRSLGELGFPEEQWPRIAMPDRPVNQDGCKGSTLELEFAGTSREVES